MIEESARRAQKAVIDEAEAVADARSKLISTAIRGLSSDERSEFVRQYAASGGAVGSYVEAEGAFKNVLEKTAFTAWLAGRIGETLA
ncbi:hypothetical protein [Burkholderia cepacia]|uniref:hypothetical protein n=1 Tax=Burkholderia cepacia TaxID=292 RepID=UPI002ABE6161|nr:hypothetical protein [Burkholderia cepacia]